MLKTTQSETNIKEDLDQLLRAIEDATEIKRRVKEIEKSKTIKNVRKIK